jgi:hypothetical protein
MSLESIFGTVAQLFFLPGDSLAWLVLRHTPTANLLGVTPGMYGSFASAAFSGLAWIAAFVAFLRMARR